MTILAPILKAVVSYFILMFIGTNLIGLIVRGIVQQKMIFVTAILVITIGYLYSLYHFWNYGVAFAGLVLILSRLSDVLFEIKTGQKVNAKNMPKTAISYISTIASWLTLPLLWYSFYILNTQ